MRYKIMLLAFFAGLASSAASAQTSQRVPTINIPTRQVINPKIPVPTSFTTQVNTANFNSINNDRRREAIERIREILRNLCRPRPFHNHCGNPPASP